jgi:hypothetical protein
MGQVVARAAVEQHALAVLARDDYLRSGSGRR